MSKKLFYSVGLFALLLSAQSFAGVQRGKNFDRVITVIFENKNYQDAIKQPFFKQLADQGAHFTNFLALAHPSQPNYVAMTSGSFAGVNSNGHFDINSTNIVDLLEAKGISWKVYAEGYPGKCYLGDRLGAYARKHNPFISYLNIQKNPTRCANIVNATEFDKDVSRDQLPSYVFYIPDNKNNAHDTSLSYANKWYSGKFSKLVNDTNFMKNTILISTFDENDGGGRNQIYTSIVGPSITAGEIKQELNIYSLLKLVEDNWELGNLGREDARATAIPNIWR